MEYGHQEIARDSRGVQTKTCGKIGVDEEGPNCAVGGTVSSKEVIMWTTHIKRKDERGTKKQGMGVRDPIEVKK